MTPQHHEERLRQLAKEMGRPVLSIDYGKSPEFIFPYAIEECFDVYRSLIESNGRILGMGMGNPEDSNGGDGSNNVTPIRIILTGDSAGGNIATSVMFKILEYPQPFIKTAYSNLKASSKTKGFGLSPLPRPLAMLLAYPSLNFEFTAWMKPHHLRVLRSQSQVNLNSMSSQARQEPKALTGGEQRGNEARGNDDSKNLKPTRSVSATRSRSRSRRPSLSSPIALLSPKDERSRELVMASSKDLKNKGKGSKTSAGNEEDEAIQMERRKSYTSLAGQAQMHLSERAKFAEAEKIDLDGNSTINSKSDDHSLEEDSLRYGRDSSRSPSRSGSEYGGRWLGRIEGDEMDLTISSLNDPDLSAELKAQEELSKAQVALSKAREAADELAAKRGRGKSGAVQTRLTMTSMSAYYSDRILTQSMMRAMAILYIGGRRQPNFDEDYLLSPITAPDNLLAELPPVLFICGEKDPICDDTVVMAGRIREAKLAKQLDIKRRREGASARFGESLRLSSSSNANKIPKDPIEDEEPEDWVQMKILEGWSHGFLQMSALLPESKEVISFLASWMRETFEDSEERLMELEEEKKFKDQSESQRKSNKSNETKKKGDDSSKAMDERSKLVDAQKASSQKVGANQDGKIGIHQSRVPSSLSQKMVKQPSRSDVEDEDDAPLSFKTKRSSPVQKHAEIVAEPSPIGPLNTPTQTTYASPNPFDSKSQTESLAVKSVPSSASVPNPSSVSNLNLSEKVPASSTAAQFPLQSATITSLQAQSRSRPRPSSFSKVEDVASSSRNPSQVLQSRPNLSRPSSININPDYNSSDDESQTPFSSTSNATSSSPPSKLRRRRLSLDESMTPGSVKDDPSFRKERLSKNAAGSDNQYKKLLVEENTLLQRRRFDVLDDLGQSTSALHSDDDEDEDGDGSGLKESVEGLQDEKARVPI